MSKQEPLPFRLLINTALAFLSIFVIVQEYSEQHTSLYLYLLCSAFIFRNILKEYGDYFEYLEQQDPEYKNLEAIIQSQIYSGSFELMLEDVLDNAHAPRAIQALNQDNSGWEAEFVQNGFPLYIRPMSQKHVIRILHEIHSAPDTDKNKEENEKLLMCLTISAIVYGFKIPVGAVCGSKEMTKRLYQYLALTEPVGKQAIIERAMIKYPPATAPKRTREERLSHEELVACLPNAFTYIEHSFDKKTYRAKNFYLIREIILKNSQLHPNGFSVRLSKLSDEQLRQVFTMAYLSIGAHVPLDYICVNDFVLDYVRKTEKYHKFNKPKFTIVNPTNESV
jgi:hypothetical protein